MARGDLTPQEIALRQQISNNIKTIMSRNNIRQIDVHLATGIPKSTINGYIKGNSIPIAGNVQKLANFFGVKKSDIDDRYDTTKYLTAYSNTDTLSDASQKLLNIFKKLDATGQSRLLAYAEFDLQQQNLPQVVCDETSRHTSLSLNTTMP
jgi:transcriptional regulator with XRE-family HTH domain